MIDKDLVELYQVSTFFDIIKRLEKLETNDKETRELLQKVVKELKE